MKTRNVCIPEEMYRWVAQYVEEDGTYIEGVSEFVRCAIREKMLS